MIKKFFVRYLKFHTKNVIEIPMTNMILSIIRKNRIVIEISELKNIFHILDKFLKNIFGI